MTSHNRMDMPMPRFGAGLWHFGQYVDRYATDGYGPPVSTLQAIERAGQVEDLSVVDMTYPFNPGDVDLEEIEAALSSAGLGVIGITPEFYTGRFAKGGFTNPDPEVRRAAIDLVQEGADMVRRFGADYVKLWPGQDGWDYPFQVDYGQLWNYSLDALRELATANPDLKFAIEYKPREPRNTMLFSSAARTLLAIEEIGLPNIGILLDFGHSLYGGETPAEAARLAIAHDRLFAIDVNDNFRGWDDDMVVGSVHLTETFEFFHTLTSVGWEGVWQLDQFPFREDAVEAADHGIRVMKLIHRALQALDDDALAAARQDQNALAAQKVVQRALLSAWSDD